MTCKRVTALTIGGLLLLALADRAAAAGGGIQLGPALLFPSLDLTATYDSNIGLTSDNTESDWLTTISPTLRLVLPVRRFFVSVEGGLEFRSYSDNDGENSTNWSAGAAAGAQFPGGLSFKIADTHAQRYLVGSQEYGPGEDSSLNTLQATVAYAIRDALRLELSGLRNVYAYDSSAERERAESTLQADLYWKFRPGISALVEASVADYAYDSNRAQDGGATQVALGLTWDVTAKSTGFAKAGYQWKGYDEENLPLGIENASYFTLAAGVRHFFTRRTLAQLELARGSHESDFPENPYYLRTSLGASISQRFTPKLYGRANLRYARDEYPAETTYENPFDPAVGAQTGERADSVLTDGVAVGFDVTRWLALELAYAGERRTSNFDTFEYNDTRVSLSAKAAF